MRYPTVKNGLYAFRGMSFWDPKTHGLVCRGCYATYSGTRVKVVCTSCAKKAEADYPKVLYRGAVTNNVTVIYLRILR